MRKQEGAPVPLVFPGGQPAGTGEFHETGEYPSDYPKFFARYTNGKPVILPGSDAGGQGVRAQVGGGEGHVETTLSPLLMRAAEDPKGNPWDITLDDMSERQFGGGRMVDLTLMDFQALYGRQGLAEAQARYGTANEPDKPAPPGTNPEVEALREKLAEKMAALEVSERLRLAGHAEVQRLKLGVGAVLGRMANGGKDPDVAKVPKTGKGVYAQTLREHQKALLALLAVLLLAILPLTGCASLRALLPGGVTAQDSEWSGPKTGKPIPVVSLLAILDPRAERVSAALTLLDRKDPLGVLLPVTPVGETSARWVYCGGKLAAKCGAFPMNTTVHFAGQPLPLPAELRTALAQHAGGEAPDTIWRPSRLVADNFND